MENAYSLSTPNVHSVFGLNKDHFGPWKKDEEIFGPEVSYFGTMDALMYLDNYINSQIYFIEIYIYSWVAKNGEIDVQQIR